MPETTDTLMQRLMQRAIVLSASQADALLRDAQQQAEQDVRELLRETFRAALLKQALASLGLEDESQQNLSQACADAPTAQWDQQSQRSFGDPGPPGEIPEPEATGPTVFEAVAAGDLAESGRHRLGCYVYGIVLADHPQLPTDAPSVDSRSGAEMLPCGRLKAIISRVPLDAFEPDLDAPSHGLGWLEAKARAHDRVLKIAAEQGPLAPLRFGSVFHREADVVGLLSEHEQRFVDLLHSLRGKSEWGVKLFYRAGFSRPDAGSAAFEDDPRTAAAAAEKSSSTDRSGSGRAYLLEKRRKKQQIAGAKAMVRLAAQECHQLLSAAASDAVALPLRAVGFTDRTDQLLLNGSYLLERSQIDPFHDVVDRMAQHYQPLGIQLELSGPWPLYNFANLQFAADPEDESAVAGR